MKITVNISDSVGKELKEEAARQGCTTSKLVEMALRMLLQKQPPVGELPPLLEFDMGQERVDIADRKALYDKMEE